MILIRDLFGSCLTSTRVFGWVLVLIRMTDLYEQGANLRTLWPLMEGRGPTGAPGPSTRHFPFGRVGINLSFRFGSEGNGEVIGRQHRRKRSAVA